jgi:hypothetical protein
MSYNLAIDTEERPGDKVFEKDGVKVFVDLKSFLFLDGSTLDYKEEGLMQRGFTFLNPSLQAPAAAANHSLCRGSIDFSLCQFLVEMDGWAPCDSTIFFLAGTGRNSQRKRPKFEWLMCKPTL